MATLLSTNEVRTRAAEFAREWKDAAYEKGETQSFYNDFFQVFGVRRRSVAHYEKQVRKLDNHTGFIDLFWPGVLLVEQKSTGRNLSDAYDQAEEYFTALKENQRPQYILVSDFQSFELHDLDEREITRFSLNELPDFVEVFDFIRGIQKRTFREQDPVNVKIAEAMGRLHDTIAATGYTGHDLELLLVRIVFCMFADNTGIFNPRHSFLQFLEIRTLEDGSDLGPRLMEIFQVLNTPDEERLSARDEDILQFPYINGELFSEVLRIPAFESSMRQALIGACMYDWSKVSPAIFGALFQSVMDANERRAQGAHYTTESNILKVIEPLFLDHLRQEFANIATMKEPGRRVSLKRFQTKLAQLNFLDPACGCGNFLVIAYREIRELELKVIQELRNYGELAVPEVNVHQFYGIEINEFPVRIASTAMWMMDHIMNNKVSLLMGSSFVRIPLDVSPHIVQADALEIEWDNLLPRKKCTYVFGNPPFVGSKYQSKAQRDQVCRIASLGGSGGTLDYVAAWFIRAANYAQTTDVRIGFVATNSITQGEQVSQLWPILFNRYTLEIAYAHRTFAWGSDVRGRAHVHVVVIGLDRTELVQREKRLFSYPDVRGSARETSHSVLSPYLLDAGGLTNPHVSIREEPRPINGLPTMVMGSKPIDGGFYIFDNDERDDFLGREPSAEKYLRPYVGAREFLQGGERWILALHNIEPQVLSRLKHVKKRISLVRSFRKSSKASTTRKLAATPTQYHLNVIPKSPFLVLPGVSSERREYIPIGWLEPPTIPSNLLIVLENATLDLFALLTSNMHMTWLRYVGGRLKNSYRYSIGMVYNTFPLPGDNVDTSKLSSFAQPVLDARHAYQEASLSELYDPDSMPVNLLKAHQALDRVVERIYRPKGFSSDHERIAHLFHLYEISIQSNRLITSGITSETRFARKKR